MPASLPTSVAQFNRYLEVPLPAPVVANPGVDLSQKVDYPRVHVFIDQPGGGLRTRNACAHEAMDRKKIIKHFGELLVTVLSGSRHVEAVGSGQAGDDSVPTLQVASKSIVIVIPYEQTASV